MKSCRTSFVRTSHLQVALVVDIRDILTDVFVDVSTV